MQIANLEMQKINRQKMFLFSKLRKFFKNKFCLAQGFSLAELLVVIGIIAILGAVGLPIIKSFQSSFKLTAAARDLVVNLRSVQQTAVAEQVDYGLRFSFANNSYQVLKFSTTTQEILNKTLPTDVFLYQISGFTNEEVVFNVLGAVKESGTVVIKNNQGSTKTIEVRPSGFVKIQ